MKINISILFGVIIGMILVVSGCKNSEGTLLEGPATRSYSTTTTTDSPVGWGESVTGGGENGTSTTVTTYSELKSALSDTSYDIIYIDGEITVDSRITIQNRDDFSIIGINNARLISDDLTKSRSGIFYIKSVTNMILQNITFEGPGAYDVDGYDSLCLDNCQYVWVDHCDFQDGMDGNFDIKNMSDFISVTWCIFQYKKSPIAGGSGGTDDHRYTNLIGSGDGETQDETHLNVTFNFCWWTDGCKERMPRVRFGKVHILNCLYDSSNSNYCIGAGYKSNIRIEGSYFDSQNNPWKEYGSYSAIGAVNCSGLSGFAYGSVFTPAYDYSVYNASEIITPIKSNAGPTL